MKVKISVIGHFGNGEKLLNGQTIKTKIVTEELQERFGKEQVIKIDTCGGLKNILKAPFQTFKALKKSENVLIFPAQNGLRIYAPLLALQKKFFKKCKVHYVVIGGWLPQFLSNRKKLTQSLKSFDGVYVETASMKKVLLSKGFENVYILPNCKKINVVSKEDLKYDFHLPYNLCTFSRVMKEKGIETAVNTVKKVNNDLGYVAYSLDIYGQVESEQREWFERLQQNFPEYINYRGSVNYSESVGVLKKYFALLFPTYYDGEGFAGTLIDAYSAGLPVIASDWKYNSELVNENVGMIFPVEDVNTFSELLKRIAVNPSLILDKKLNCLKEAKKYSIDVVINQLIEIL